MEVSNPAVQSFVLCMFESCDLRMVSGRWLYSRLLCNVHLVGVCYSLGKFLRLRLMNLPWQCLCISVPVDFRMEAVLSALRVLNDALMPEKTLPTVPVENLARPKKCFIQGVAHLNDRAQARSQKFVMGGLICGFH